MNLSGNPQDFDLNVDLSKLDAIECSSCGGKLFKQAFMLKKLPKIMTGAPTDIPVSIPIWKCINCNNVLTEFVSRAAGSLDGVGTKLEGLDGTQSSS